MTIVSHFHFCREGGKKPEVFHDKSCHLFKSWCEGHPGFEVARAASEAGFDDNQPVFMEIPTSDDKKEAKVHNPTLEACVHVPLVKEKWAHPERVLQSSATRVSHSLPGPVTRQARRAIRVVTVIMNSGNLFPQSLTFESLKK